MELSKDISTKLSSLKDSNGNKIELENMDLLVSDLVSLFKEHCDKYGDQLFHDIKNIGNKAHEARVEFSDQNEKKDNIIVSTASELDAVIKSTEEATNKILDSAENIQNISSSVNDQTASKGITDNVMVIFEACNFQDITGQRIKKISSALDFIEDSVGDILKKYSFSDISNDKRDDAELMEGPQSAKNKPDQDDIDKLFDSV